MNIPSVKTLETIDRGTLETKEQAKLLRKVLTFQGTIYELLEQFDFPRTTRWVKDCYHDPSLRTLKLHIADEILGTYGVEHIDKGRNAKSPAIDYCNTGDPYRTTLMYIHGRGFRVGCWGDIVERGNYE